MGIIPVATLGVAASYAEDALSMPLPVVVATVLAVLTVVGLRILGGGGGEGLPCAGAALRLRRRLIEQSPARVSSAALLPRLTLRAPNTHTPRPAPAVAASGRLRGPPGYDLPSRRHGTGGGILPR
jgi:hypothetical protein